MVRAVVFDFWNTLVHSRGGDPSRRLHALMTEIQQPFFSQFKREAMDRPHANAQALLECWRPRIELSEDQMTAMAGVFRDAVEGVECFPEALKALRETRNLARVALLSNIQSFESDLLEQLEFTPLIPNRFLSFETGLVKPELDAFQAVQKKLSLFPGQIVMVGDSWNDDVQGALNAGWTVLWLNREGMPRPEHDPDAELIEIADLAAVPAVVERLQAGARCSTCLG